MSRIRPATYNLRIPQRATFEEIITLKADNVPVNLNGYTVVAQIWKTEKRREKIADLTVTYINRNAGTIKLSLTRSQTRNLKIGGHWDMLVIEPGGAADYWLEGSVSLYIGLTDTE